MSDRILNTNEVIREIERYKFAQLHIHHTWKPTHRNFTGNNHLNLQNNMRYYHKNSLGWADIGQHLTLMPDGKFVTGRPYAKTPASVKGHNSGALAVEMVGNFDTKGSGQYNDLGYDELKGEQRLSILALIRWFGEKYGYENVKFHRDFPGVTKTCPGTSLDKKVLLTQAKGQNPRDKNAPTWKKYISGEIIKRLQRELNVQFNKGLKVDGYMGDLTIAALINVRKGARGNITRIIQERLKSLGYSLGPAGVDGKFGPATHLAVRMFQKDKNLKVDGVVGVNTWKALMSI